MVAKNISTIDELIEFIFRCIADNEISIVKIEKQSGISQGLISRWKNHSANPSLSSLINVFHSLSIDFVLKSSENSCGKSMEQKIHSTDELIEFIYRYIDDNKISIGKIEEQSGISQGLLSRWKNHSMNPNIAPLMDVLNFLNIQIILKTDYEEESKVIQDIIAYVNTITSSNITSFNKKLFLEILKWASTIASSDMTSSDGKIILNILECVSTMVSSNMTSSDKELILNILNSSIQLYHR